MKQFLIYSKEFGLSMACVQLKESLIERKNGYSDYYIKNASEYMIKELQLIIREYQKTSGNIVFPSDEMHCSDDKRMVWICWWQGYEKMPPIVRACYRRVCNVFNDEKSEVVLITEKNYSDYITFPDYIIKKYQSGIISNAHYADILRWGLMAKYGGIWIDATVFLTYDSSDAIKKALSLPFYTRKLANASECPNEPCRGLWCNFYFMGHHNSNVRIFSFVYNSLLFYWKKHEIAFHYVFLDYIIWAAYQNISDIKELIDKVPANNKHVWYLSSRMNDIYNEEEWKLLLSKNDFYKLTYKSQWVEYTPDKKSTYYGYIINQL